MLMQYAISFTYPQWAHQSYFLCSYTAYHTTELLFRAKIQCFPDFPLRDATIHAVSNNSANSNTLSRDIPFSAGVADIKPVNVNCKSLEARKSNVNK